MRRVVIAIECFDRWDAPWTFCGAVRADPTLGADDRALFEQVWSTACNARHWTTARCLDTGVAMAERALAQQFAWLSPLARRHLAQAAAYEWR
ncbi:hypothetical protein NC00_05775 [Xanthomonas cannabis pv. phaseoli]|uniref:Uncharacterized protein n=1 Tax=Xanthomonas cannabis pv. phaseoli TaxID=1885902 RepID=A0AB34PAU9_9XANT|nr:hypothetical protein NC00_05775 [Xanthomonas cannabis pv. phaseoli]